MQLGSLSSLLAAAQRACFLSDAVSSVLSFCLFGSKALRIPVVVAMENRARRVSASVRSVCSWCSDIGSLAVIVCEVKTGHLDIHLARLGRLSKNVSRHVKLSQLRN